MSKASPEELGTACEEYPSRWHRNNKISAETWQDILTLFYKGHGCGYIMRHCDLPESCRRSLQEHRREHKRHIGREMEAVFLEQRKSGAVTFAERYDELRAEVMEMARDPGLSPTQRLRCIEGLHLNLVELRKIMELAAKMRGEMQEPAAQKTQGDLKRLGRITGERLQAIDRLYGIKRDGDGGSE